MKSTSFVRYPQKSVKRLVINTKHLLLELDASEYAHIRLLCLLNPNKCYSSEIKLKTHHKKVTLSLSDYVGEKSQDTGIQRTISIFQGLSILVQLDGKTVEKLFFNILVDFIKIDHVIPYIMNLNANSKDAKQNVKKENDYELNDENNEDLRYYGDC